ncbi:protein kinase domain-containing protein [Legionella cardiaca]|uniref:Protein kinase n=1 Tax=Legionella cardiaca TaxID=1071983 RepID=A0ABY8ARA6_9GAMM|nr:protein kinase [Legionella cardiaca]WED43219.1 protein kinase [Legionella cardiaca]
MYPDSGSLVININLNKIHTYPPEIIAEVSWILKQFSTPLLQKGKHYTAQSNRLFSFSNDVVLFRSNGKGTPRYAILEDNIRLSEGSAKIFLIKKKLLADENGLLYLKPVYYIAKYIEEPMLATDIATEVQREYVFSKRVKHLHCKEPVLIKGKKAATAAFLIMHNLGPSSLENFLNQLQEYDSDFLIDLAIDLTRALNKQVHRRNIIHRDIKPANITYDSSRIPPVKICDFGLSKENGEKTANENVGTASYKSHEQLKGRYTTKKSDIASLGLTIADSWNMCFDPESDKELYNIDSFCDAVNDLTNSDKETIVKIINSMICEDPRERPELNDLEEQLESLLLTRKLRRYAAQRAENIALANCLGLELRKKLDEIESCSCTLENTKEIIALLDEVSLELFKIPENIKEFSERLKCNYLRNCKTIFDFNQKNSELKKIYYFYTVQANQLITLSQDDLLKQDKSFKKVFEHFLATEKYDVTIDDFILYADKLNKKLMQFKTSSPFAGRKILTYDSLTLEPVEHFPIVFKQLKRSNLFTKDMSCKKQRQEAYYENCFEALTESEQKMVTENSFFF